MQPHLYISNRKMLFESYWPLPQILPSPGELTSQEVGKILSKSLTTFMALLNVVILTETRSNITLCDAWASNLPFSIAIPIFFTVFHSFLIITPRRIKSYIEQNPLINYFTIFSLPFCLATKCRYSMWNYSVPSTCPSEALMFSRSGDWKFCSQFKVGRITLCLGQ